MPVVIISCMLLLVLTALIHYEVLHALHVHLPKLRVNNRTKLLLVMLAIFLAHAVEIGVYAVTLFGLIRHMDVGSLSSPGEVSLLQCFYFSAETYTSLGMGDIAPTGPVRLVAGAEALNGLLLIAWSASFAYLSMERYWAPDSRK